MNDYCFRRVKEVSQKALFWRMVNGSCMTNFNAKKFLIGMKFGTRDFLRSLVMNRSSTFRNLELRIQYGLLKNKKLCRKGSLQHTFLK